jgi:hypothetical protein
MRGIIRTELFGLFRDRTFEFVSLAPLRFARVNPINAQKYKIPKSSFWISVFGPRI